MAKSRENMWESLGKVGVKLWNNFMLWLQLWESGGFARVLRNFYTTISTGFFMDFNLKSGGFCTVST